MQNREPGILKRTLNFQKLMAMYTFTTEDNRLYKYRDGYKRYVLVFSAAMLSTLFLNLLLSPMLSSFMLITLMMQFSIFCKGGPAFCKTLPVKNSFVIANFLLLHPLCLLGMSLLFFMLFLPGEVSAAVGGHLSYYSAHLYLILFLSSSLLYAAWLTVYFIREKRVQFVAASALLAVSVAAALLAWTASFPLLPNMREVSGWADHISALNMLIFTGAVLLVIAISSRVCVKLYERFY